MLIAARQTLWGGAAEWKNPYVTDGLVAMWDGEWNAGPGKHNANATVWKDLVSSHDLSRTGNPVISSDSVQVDNDNYYSRANDVLTNSSFTIEAVWMPHVANVTDRQPLGNNGYGGFTLINRGNTLWGAAVGFGGSYRWINFGTITAGELCQISYSGSNGSQIARKNGVVTNTDSISGSYYYNVIKPFGIGKSGSAIGCDSTYYNVRIYSRALTAAEVAANYAVDKARFNLTAS